MTGFAAGLRAGGPARTSRPGLWLTFLSPFGLEVAAAGLGVAAAGLGVAAAGGAEWIAIDVQHGDLDLADVAPLARASPVPVLVRLASHDGAQLARALDAGVDGVIVPAVESAAQARRLVQAACFPPRGRNRALTGRLPAVDLLGVDTDAAALRAGLELIFGPPAFPLS
jgi:4-hydroxy-2-oxoheptanedioate aldolase